MTFATGRIYELLNAHLREQTKGEVHSISYFLIHYSAFSAAKDM